VTARSLCGAPGPAPSGVFLVPYGHPARAWP